MSDNRDDNVFDLFGDHDDGEFEDTGSDETDAAEVDPGLVAFMDQQAAEFNAKAEHEFADRYGFVHKCKCDEDYARGNMVSVTECYANMTLEALDAAATLHAENRMLRSLITMAVGKGVNDESSTTELDPEVHGYDDSETDDHGTGDYDAFA